MSGQARDRRAEATMLVRAATTTGADPGDYAARVLARLDVHGQHIAPGRTPADLLAELAEEALDLGGWSALAAQHPDAGPLLPTLRELAALGATALAVCDRVRCP